MKKTAVVFREFWLLLFFSGPWLLRAENPETFPEVALSEDSEPRYASVALDFWKGRSAYVLFDGTFREGYKSAYVWIPGDRRHDPPTKYTPDSKGDFGAFDFSSEGEKGEFQGVWRFRQRYYKRSARTVTRRNYATGKTYTERRKASEGYRLYYSVDFEYALPESLRKRSRLPLSITISDNLGTATVWDEVAADGFQPWRDLRINLGMEQVHENDRCRVTFKAGGVGVPGASSRLHSIPEAGSEIAVQVAPYLEAPVFSNTVSLAEIMSPGLTLDVPYGWYHFRFSEYTFGAMKFPVRLPGVNLSPYPLTRD